MKPHYQWPCSLTIETQSDFLALEKRIRFILGCDGSYCSFLQSADYMNLKFMIQRTILSKLTPSLINTNDIIQRVFHIPKTNFVLCLLDNNKTIIIRDNSDYLHQLKIDDADELSTVLDPMQKQQTNKKRDIDTLQTRNHNQKEDMQSPMKKHKNHTSSNSFESFESNMIQLKSEKQKNDSM